MINKVKNLHIRNNIAKATRMHIKKCINNESYNTKSLLAGAVALDVYSNIVDYVEIGHNKKLDKDEKNYLQAYKIVNASVSALAQTTAGLFITSDKAQKFISEKIPAIKNIDKKEHPDVSKNIKKFSMLLGAVVLTKRVIVPFIVTPLASLLKKKLDANSKSVLTYEKNYGDSIKNNPFKQKVYND